mgnify:CR=1 FL=1
MEVVTYASFFVKFTMSKETKYPRYRFRRTIINSIGRGLLRLLAKVKIEGIENIPKKGAVILSGNHVDNLEAAFAMFFSNRIIEPIGAGDIPFDKGWDGWINFYGFISIDRGSLDRAALREAISLLKQGGALNIFPEGGTWRPGQMKAHIGVALLSERCQAPVVPIGYSGFYGTLKGIFKFKRPVLTMRVGKPIPPLVIDKAGPPVKTQMQIYADEVMRQVFELVDEEELSLSPDYADYHLIIKRGEPNGKTIKLPPIEGGDGFLAFTNMKVVLDTLKISLSLPTDAFYPNIKGCTLKDFIEAIDATNAYLKEKPHFFRYRMDDEIADKIPNCLDNLRRLALESQNLSQALILEGHITEFYHNGEERSFKNCYHFLP